MTNLENEIHGEMVGIVMTVLLLTLVCFGASAMYNSLDVDTEAPCPCIVDTHIQGEFAAHEPREEGEG